MSRHAVPAGHSRFARARVVGCETAAMRIRVGYMASGAASSARGIHTAAADGALDVTSAVLIGNNSRSGALDWARDAGVPAYHLSGATHTDPEALDIAIRDALLEHDVDL